MRAANSAIQLTAGPTQADGELIDHGQSMHRAPSGEVDDQHRFVLNLLCPDANLTVSGSFDQ
jgi:hypothetical protein